MLPALKPTRCLTNSEIMSHQLNRRCSKDHVHQPLVGGRCRDAAMYPVPLVKAMLRGIELQHKEGIMLRSSRICAMPMSYNSGKVESFGPPTHSSIPRVNGGSTPITYDQSNFKDRYLDEYTGELLAPNLIRAAIEDELNYFNSKVWQLSTVSEMEKVPGHILVRSRWALCNKGDSDSPDVRARLVSCELNKGDKNDAFSASTPPLEGKRILFARYTSERTRKGRPFV